MLGSALSLPHLLLIGVAVLVLFGKGKIASAMGEVGKGITSFRKAVENGQSRLADEAEASARDITSAETRT